MINMPECIREDYLLVEKLRNFCKEHGLKTSQNKVELLNSILSYAGEDKETPEFNEVFQWLATAIKEGSKELCYKKIFPNPMRKNDIDHIMMQQFPNCPQEEILIFVNEGTYRLANYSTEVGLDQYAIRTSFAFSKKILEGVEETTGKEGIYPIYIDIYWDKGFIVSRGKAKSTIYNLSENGMIYRGNKINTIKDAQKMINQIILTFDLKIDASNVSKQRNKKMLFNLYKEYSFTPEEIKTKISNMTDQAKKFVISVFSTLNLDYKKTPKAIEDINIFLEKFITTNGNMEDIFKKDRDAYIIKVTSDDPLQMTRISTSSVITKPLQCTDAFFDGKKSTMRSKECKKLNLCYNRSRGYLKNFTAQFEVGSECGVIKLRYYAEECDIQNVLQKVFENY